ncbi:MAG: OadG family protein [Clostridia bacterium]|nr:OadG family protein [Clostridia bacterium]
MSIPSWFVIVMGMGTVFIGLICIILLCKILGAICSIDQQKQNSVGSAPAPAPAPAAPAAAAVATGSVNRQEIIAAIGVAIAEECGVDTNAIRIVSIKKI